MDLKTLSIDNDPVDFELIHLKTGEKTGVVFHLVGLDHERPKEVERRQAKQKIQRAQKSGSLNKVIKTWDFDEAQQQKVEIICACISGWKGLTKDEKELKYTPQAALDLLSDPKLAWIVEEIEKFVTDRANFMKG